MHFLIDSSGPELVCALSDGNEIMAERRTGERAAGRYVAEIAADVLGRRTPAELDSIVVGTGPGSFIGTRTAISFANGYGAASGVELRGVDSLAAIAAVELCPVLRDARRGQLYLYVPGAEAHLLDAGAAVAELQRIGAPSVVLEHVPGDRGTERALLAVEPLLTAAGIELRLTRGVPAAGLLRLAEVATPQSMVEPVYLRGFT